MNTLIFSSSSSPIPFLSIFKFLSVVLESLIITEHNVNVKFPVFFYRWNILPFNQTRKTLYPMFPFLPQQPGFLEVDTVLKITKILLLPNDLSSLSLDIQSYSVLMLEAVSNPLGNKLDKNYKLNLCKVPMLEAESQILNRSHQQIVCCLVNWKSRDVEGQIPVDRSKEKETSSGFQSLMKLNPYMATRLYIFSYLPQGSLFCPLPFFHSLHLAILASLHFLELLTSHTISFRSLLKCYLRAAFSPPIPHKKMAYPSLSPILFIPYFAVFIHNTTG